MSAAIEVATADQPGAQAALIAALATGPSHAYLFAGPRGTGKTGAARAFAAELLADGAPDPASARRRAMIDPSPHPDLTWLRPAGNQHLVDEVRERVISAACYLPFEGERRVFVIEAADAMADEAQSALLKTLEEPPSYAHLILLAAERAELLETVISRCQQVTFVALPAQAIERRLADEGVVASADELTAAARLCGGDLERARFLLTDTGRALREKAELCMGAAAGGDLSGRPWSGLLEIAEVGGSEEGERVEAELRHRAEDAGDERLVKRLIRDAEASAKRAARRRRTELLDVGLALCSAWYRDLIAIAAGAPELVAAGDRGDQLRAAARTDPDDCRAAIESIADTRRRLEVNVSEELALEALFGRLAERAAALR